MVRLQRAGRWVQEKNVRPAYQAPSSAVTSLEKLAYREVGSKGRMFLARDSFLRNRVLGSSQTKRSGGTYHQRRRL